MQNSKKCMRCQRHRMLNRRAALAALKGDIYQKYLYVNFPTLPLQIYTVCIYLRGAIVHAVSCMKIGDFIVKCLREFEAEFKKVLALESRP
jgi:hypothetical protein